LRLVTAPNPLPALVRACKCNGFQFVHCVLGHLFERESARARESERESERASPRESERVRERERERER